MKIKKTGSIQLLGKLKNKRIWKAFMDGSLPIIHDQVSISLESGGSKNMLFVVTNIILKGKTPLHLMYDIDMPEVFQKESKKEGLIIGEAFVNIIHEMISESWTITGGIIGASGDITPILLLYFESFDFCWYSTLDLAQNDVLEKYIHNLN